MALTGEGAAGWASGSQNWPKGHMPILMPNPMRNNAKASAVATGLVLSIAGRFALTVSKSYFKLALPLAAAPRHGQQLGADHGGGAGNLHHDQILVGGADVGRVLVLEADQRIARQRHHLPEDEEEPHHVGRAEQAVHRRQEEQEIGIVARHAVVLVVPHIGDGVKRRGHRDQRRQQQEHRRQAVHINAQREANLRHRSRTRRDVPRARDQARGPQPR